MLNLTDLGFLLTVRQDFVVLINARSQEKVNFYLRRSGEISVEIINPMNLELSRSSKISVSVDKLLQSRASLLSFNFVEIEGAYYNVRSLCLARLCLPASLRFRSFWTLTTRTGSSG